MQCGGGREKREMEHRAETKKKSIIFWRTLKNEKESKGTTLTRVIMEVHVQTPHDKVNFGEMNVCEYCELRTGRIIEKTREHEANCRHDPEGLEKIKEKCKRFVETTREADRKRK